jgi:CRP-like cAMP-binding protein
MIAIMHDRLVPLFDDARARAIEPDSPLFHSGDTVRSMFLVVQGAATLTRMTGKGTPVILQRAHPGQVLAEASAYSRTYRCDGRTVTAAILRSVPVARFRARLANDSKLSEIWASHLAHAVQAARMRAEVRTLRTVAERLDAWLGEGRALPEKGHWQELAAELGVSREALYRELAKRR